MNQWIDPRILASLFGGAQQPPPMPFGMAPQLPAPSKDQTRMPMGMPNIPLPLDPTDQVGLGATGQTQLPQNAAPAQGMTPPGIPMPSGRPPMGTTGQEQPMPLGGFGAPNLGGPAMPMTQPRQQEQQGGGFGDFIRGLGENPMFLAGLTTLGGFGPGAGAQIANASRYRTGTSSDIQEYEYAKRQGFDGSFQDWIANKRAGAGEVSLNPVWGEDEQGNPVIGQLNKRGEFVKTKLPEGVTPSKGFEEIDMGTEWGVVSKITGQLTGRYPKDIAGKEREEKAGAGRGEAIAALESINSKMPGLETVIKRLDDLSNKATFTMAGQGIDAARRQAGMEPREAAIARAEYISIVDNQILPLLRDTFGAQFTQREGESLKATLGDPNKSPKEKQAVLRAFIEQKRRDVAALAMRAGQGGSPQPAPVQNDPLGIR